MSTEWSIPMTERSKYDHIFDGLQPVNGLLTGDKVKPVLLNSNLPVDVLGHVWDLSDIDGDGFLDRDEFTVAMHLVYRALERNPVPTVLPPEMIPPSKRKRGAAMPGAVPVLPSVPVMPALAGPAAPVLPVLAGSLGTGTTIPMLSAPVTVPVVVPGSIPPVRTSPTMVMGVKWVVSPAEKAQYDEMFVRADADRDGLVNGAEIKDIFLQSGLPQPVLAHIWNLCDTRAVGKLNSDQFALAMYLVQQKLKGIDPPAQLSPDMIPPSLRAFQFPDTSGIAPMVSLETAGMKELDVLSKDIEDLKREKMKLEQEKTQKEADIKIRSGEVMAMQKELDAISNTVKQLEMQKAEAQKRLDELDDKKLKLESSLKECKEKYIEEQNQIKELQYQITHRESIATNQEAEMKRMRDEFNELRQEEIELEQKVDGSRHQVTQLDRRLTDTQTQISQVKMNMQRLRDTQKSLTHSVGQYNALLNNELTEGALTQLETTSSSADLHPTVSSQTVTLSSARDSITSGFGDFTVDPFASKDPFAAHLAQDKDPFHSEDPFASGVDPFSSSLATDPFAGSAAAAADPFGGDPFTDAFKERSHVDSPSFGSDLPKKKIVSGSDPWGAYSSTGNAASATIDSFDPFHVGLSDDAKSPLNPNDPFGTGSFVPAATGGSSRLLSPSDPPQLPPKQKRAPAPPRPPAPKPAGGSVPSGLDAFDGTDPFGSIGGSVSGGGQRSGALSSLSVRNEPSTNFAEFTPSKFASESEQLAWATRDSTQEFQRLKRLQEQEQAELELAIALSKQDA